MSAPLASATDVLAAQTEPPGLTWEICMATLPFGGEK